MRDGFTDPTDLFKSRRNSGNRRKFFNKNRENTSVQAETTSLMPYLCSFTCMQASR